MGRSISIPKITPAVRTTTTVTSDIERKIENATEGLSSECFNLLHDRVLPANKENTRIICDYIYSLKSEINLSDGYRKNNIVLLCNFASFNNFKSFTETKREVILSFLDSFRKIESVDPLHKWIGTYNLYRIQLLRFFKWLYSPDIEQKKRPKPSIIENIPQLKRKEKSIYKPTDLWTSEDDSFFLRYCPNARDRCYHAMSRDSACRPHELLKLRIKDVIFKLTPDKKQYAEILVNGKTGTRHIPLIDSIPYVRIGFHDIHKVGIQIAYYYVDLVGALTDRYEQEAFSPNAATDNNPSRDEPKWQECFCKASC